MPQEEPGQIASGVRDLREAAAPQVGERRRPVGEEVEVGLGRNGQKRGGRASLDPPRDLHVHPPTAKVGDLAGRRSVRLDRPTSCREEDGRAEAGRDEGAGSAGEREDQERCSEAEWRQHLDEVVGPVEPADVQPGERAEDPGAGHRGRRLAGAPPGDDRAAEATGDQRKDIPGDCPDGPAEQVEPHLERRAAARHRGRAVAGDRPPVPREADARPVEQRRADDEAEATEETCAGAEGGQVPPAGEEDDE